jgi:hypothetical protein
MKRNKALGVALVTALSGSLLVGCTSGNAETSTPTTPRATTPASDTTPSAYPLVGTNWRAGEGPGRRCDGDVDLPNNGFGRGLFLMADGTWNIPWCQSYGGTYEVNGDTITWLGGSDCDAGVKGTYKFTLNNGQFTQVVVDDPCGPRRDAFDGVAYYAPERTLGPSES